MDTKNVTNKEILDLIYRLGAVALKESTSKIKEEFKRIEKHLIASFYSNSSIHNGELDKFVDLENMSDENEFFKLENGETVTNLTLHQLHYLLRDGVLSMVEHPNFGEYAVDQRRLYVKVRGKMPERLKKRYALV